MNYFWKTMAVGCLTATSAMAAVDWQGTTWIWASPSAKNKGALPPAGSVFFRSNFAVSERSPVEQAHLIITADNLYEISINGRLVGSSSTDPDGWNMPNRFDVSSLLILGENVIAVQAVNTAPGAAGLILKLFVKQADSVTTELVSSKAWRCTTKAEPNWIQRDFNDQAWKPALEVGSHGCGPWGKLLIPTQLQPLGLKEDVKEELPPDNFKWPGSILYIEDDCTPVLSMRHGKTPSENLSILIFNPGHTRAFPEYDLPAPVKVGRTLCMLSPAKPGSTPRILVDAGSGALSTPTVSFDGKTIYFSMAAQNDPFYHIYSIPSKGGTVKQLTFGNYHDIDPEALPAGRVVFSSTRCGFFEEYHNPPSRALFTMKNDGTDIKVLTSTFIFDNEPRVMPDGRILILRSDNFFDRGKVETMLHAIHPSGSHGYTEFGLDLGPAAGNRLRAINFGSPAPMPDGRVAYVTGAGVAIGRPGTLQSTIRNFPFLSCDVSALPDNRLLITQREQGSQFRSAINADVPDGRFNQIRIFDPDQEKAKPILIYEAKMGKTLHSPVYVGPKIEPVQIANHVDEKATTGRFYCQNTFFTRNTSAGWSHVRAIRVLMGRGLTTRSSNAYIVHAGNETVELGTVPIMPDGSFSVEVPADRAIAFQAVDGEGRSELNEMSWIYVRPGETRGCIGCHAIRQSAALVQTNRFITAATLPPLHVTDARNATRFRGNNPAVTGLTELQFDRFREVASINRVEVPRETLEKRLSSTDWSDRVAAANHLGLLRDEQAAPSLVQQMKIDDIAEVRSACALALAACGTRHSVPALLTHTSDPNLHVRLSAAIALENLLDDPIVSTSNLMSGKGAQYDINLESIELKLITKLESTNRDIVRRAAVALRHIGSRAETKAALRKVVLALRDDPGYLQYRNKGDGAKFLADHPANPRCVQEVIRALGDLKDLEAVPLLSETLNKHADVDTGNLFVAEAAADALGKIGTPEAEAALISTFTSLKPYIKYTHWYGDHSALMACHASPVHIRIVEALDRIGTKGHPELVPHLIACVPTDFDRALFLRNDTAEQLIGRVIRNQGAEATVIETCLKTLGDATAKPSPEIEVALRTVHQAWAGTPTPEIRSSHIISLVCENKAFAPRIQEAYLRYMAVTNPLPRAFSGEHPVIKNLPVRHWNCFYLARALANLKDNQVVPALLTGLASAPEFTYGSPDPIDAGVLFLHNDMTPCWRAATAYALGEIGDKRAIPALLKTISNPSNAIDTRHAAATALGLLADKSLVPVLSKHVKRCEETSMKQALTLAVERAKSN
ncbi:MAG: HEAT repeat domain-containing protein [bacterium]